MKTRFTSAPVRVLWWALLCLGLTATAQAQSQLPAEPARPRYLVGMRYGVGVSGFVGTGTLGYENKVHLTQGGLWGTVRIGRLLGIGTEINYLTQGAKREDFGQEMINNVMHQLREETSYAFSYLQIPLHISVFLDEETVRLRAYGGVYYASLLNAEATYTTRQTSQTPGLGENRETTTTERLTEADIEAGEWGMSVGGSLDVRITDRYWFSGDLRYARAFSNLNKPDNSLPEDTFQPELRNSTLNIGIGVYMQF